MTEIKDWRGTPIEVGSKVLTHPQSKGYTPRRGIGPVTRVDDLRQERTYRYLGEERTVLYGDIWVHVSFTERSGGYTKSSRLHASNVTVLTKDMFDDVN